MLAGAALGALDTAGEAAAAGAVEAVAARLEGAGRKEAAHWLRAGATRLQSLDPADLDPSRHIEEIDFRPASTLPRMPEAVDDPEKRERWTPRVRQFYWTGKGAFSPTSGLPVQPAVLESLAETLRANSPHPFVLVPSDDPERPVLARALGDLLTEACETLRGKGRAARALGDGLPRLVTLSAELVSRQTPGVGVRSVIADAGRRLVEELRLGDEDQRSLVEDVAELGQVLPDAITLDLRSDTPVRLYLGVLEASRGPLRRRFVEELEKLREQLRDLLELERLGSSTGRAPQALASSLGRAGSDYLDPAALSRTLAGERGSQPLEPARRERIEKALKTIEDHLEERDQVPRAVLLRPPDLELAPSEADQRGHPEPLAAAVGVFDGLTRRMGPLFQAARLARLEAAGQYRPEVCAGGLPELDWEAFTAQELMLVPAVAVVTTGRRLRTSDRGALSDLVRSSRPVHVVVVDEIGAPDEAEDLSRFHIDLGYLVVAHREAYAVGSTLARPDRAVEALNHVARALRPAVALMRLPTQQPAPWRTLLAEAALQGRVCPDFRYDPDAGPSWADRFNVDGNPQPEQPWPTHTLAFLEDKTEQSLEVPFTFADAVALEPAYLRHLRIVPRAAWDDDQIPLGEYLEQFHPESRERRIPYIWVIDEGRVLQRAVVTRELAVACWDRLRSWRVLQELAGYENVFAERAATRARDAAVAEAEAQRAELEKVHADEVERVRTETARESIEKLAAALISPEGMAAAASALAPSGVAAAAVPAPAALEAPAAEPAPVEEAVEEEEVLVFDEPFIDAPLCTTCNECTNLNGQLFKYNEDKQAYIGNASAGTFEELVRAAELCPAHCIHPGKPRAGDATATPELIERAAKFN
jgi:ferredoxin